MAGQKLTQQILSGILILVLAAGGCQTNPSPSPSGSLPGTDVVFAKVQFYVTIPPKTPAGQFSFIDILDEVTGLAVNPSRYAMIPKDPGHFSLEIPFPVGSLVKYRYGRDTSPPSFEYSSSQTQIRYRVFQVNGPMVVSDVISAWDDQPYEGLFGRVTGKIFDSSTRTPIPNAMISIAGLLTLTGSDGSFLFEKVPSGNHLLSGSPLDGSFTPYQQEAAVQNGLTTQAYLPVQQRKLVRVTFIARLPKAITLGVPLRLVGDSVSLGNTYADLGGGLSTVAARSPAMKVRSDSRYELTLDLPAGMDLHYKYSLGDGLWNGELTTEGSYRIRQLIVPANNVVIEEGIEAFQAQDYAPVSFSVKALSIPEGENISIQFNPYGWTEPIPMWPLKGGEWYFVLYNPFSLADEISYRYCRNDQCGVTDEAARSTLRTFSISENAQTINDEINGWAYWEKPAKQTVIIAPPINPRSDFITGVELSSRYQPEWQPYLAKAMETVRSLEAKWLFITPSWTFTANNPPVLEPVPGRDGLWLDQLNTLQNAKKEGLIPIVFPVVNFGDHQADWWSKAHKDQGWWLSWFDRYAAFMINQADLAQQVNAKAIILGDPGIALAYSKEKTGLFQIVPSPEADFRWKQLVSDIHSRFKGEIYWAASYTFGSIPKIPDFFDPDGYYILAGGALKAQSLPELVKFVGASVDRDLKGIKDTTKKPVLMGIDYPSIQGARNGCVQSNNICVPFAVLDQPTKSVLSQAVDLVEQADIYNAFLTAINERPWISGFVSRGYYPPAALLDKSSSVHGKPASDVVWYWYSKFNQ